jgi:hypothetical protein
LGSFRYRGHVVREPQGRDNFGDFKIDGRKILQWMTEILGVEVWTRLNLWHQLQTYSFPVCSISLHINAEYTHVTCSVNTKFSCLFKGIQLKDGESLVKERIRIKVVKNMKQPQPPDVKSMSMLEKCRGERNKLLQVQDLMAGFLLT